MSKVRLHRDLYVASLVLDDEMAILQDEWAAQDPYYFLTNFVYTYDPHAGKIRQFPDKPYLAYLTQTWIEHNRLFIEKSRQMLITWIFTALFLWDAMYNNMRVTIYQSKNQLETGIDKPIHLCGRSKFIHEHLPSSMRNKYPMISTKKPPTLYFPNTQSYIIGAPQNPVFARQFTITGILWDEMAFQIRCMDSVASAIPTFDKNTKVVGVSTPNRKNFFYRLCHDIKV